MALRAGFTGVMCRNFLLTHEGTGGFGGSFVYKFPEFSISDIVEKMSTFQHNIINHVLLKS